MMKILHMVGDSKFGGGSIVILQLAKLARDLGWQVDVLTTDPSFQETLRTAEIGVVPLDVIRRDLRPLRDLAGLFRLIGFLRNSKYVMVHTHTSKAGWVGRLAAWLARTPIIIHTVHGFAFHEQSSAIVVRVCALLEKLAGRWCNRIVTVSEFHRSWGLRLGIGKSSKLVAIPNGISRERITPGRERDQLRSAYGVKPDELLILSTGRLAPLKGLEYLIDAIPMLETRLAQPFQVWVAGEGPLQNSLKSQTTRLSVGDRVHFLGFRHDVGSLLSACDLVVLPSLREGLSIALLEAMASGKPIVTTTIGSNREVTRNGEAALLVPPADTSSLVAGILRLAQDRSFGDLLGQCASKTYLESYTEDQMLAKYRALYLQLLNRPDSNLHRTTLNEFIRERIADV